MNFLIFGLGKTGFSALKYLQTQGHSCVVFDTRAKALLDPLQIQQAEFFSRGSCFFENFPDLAWENIQAVVVSPGLDPEKYEVKKILQEAIKRKLKLTSDIELFLEEIKNIQARKISKTQKDKFPEVIGITGSNGKSTVTALVYEMLKAAGCEVRIGGNFGTPALDLLMPIPLEDHPENKISEIFLDNASNKVLSKALGKALGKASSKASNDLFNNPSNKTQANKPQDAADYYVLELSSFQLELLNQPLELAVAALLNISPNHLDRHKNMHIYQVIKEKIYEKAEFKIINLAVKYFKKFDENRSSGFLLDPSLRRGDDGHQSMKLQEKKSVNVRSFGLTSDLISNFSPDFGIGFYQNQEYLMGYGEALMPLSQIRIQGRHNIENALAALAIVSVLNPEFLKPSLKVLREFDGLPHRCKLIKELNGVTWVNDSKSTTVAATEAALNGLGPGVLREGGRVILIAGGQAKGATFEGLRENISKFVKQLILLGQDADQFEKDLKGSVEISQVKDLSQAVSLAREIAASGDMVLLSPACASLDMFKNYEHRGEVFEAEVRSFD